MKKTLWVALAFAMIVGVAVILPLTSAHALEVFSAETETRIWDSTKSYNGYWITAGFGGTTYLMDMEGYIVKIWNNVPGWSPRIAEDGKLWSLGAIQDWDGNVLWKYTPSTDAPARYAADQLALHHECRKIYNKALKAYTMLCVANRLTTQAEIVAFGADPSVDYTKKAPGKTSARNAGYDNFVELDMNKNIVWEWRYTDHLIQSKNSAWPNYVSNISEHPERKDMYFMSDCEQPNGENGPIDDWWHSNSVDYNDDSGHAVISGKNFGEFYVIDHDKTFVSTSNWEANRLAAAGTAGDYLWRWGNPAAYGKGDQARFMYDGHKQQTGLHNIQWIRPYHWEIPRLATDTWPDPRTYTKSGIALPGANNFLVMDNGLWRMTGMRSANIEINPRLGSAGTEIVAFNQYVPETTAGYTAASGAGMMGTGTGVIWYKSKQTAWRFEAKTQHSYYSSIISSVQRLPNGNTTCIAGTQGHLFETTSSGEVVWDYLYPGLVTTGTPVTVMKDGGTGMLFRQFRYSPDFPGLAGKDLTRIQTITGKVPALVGTHGIEQYVAPTYYGFGFGSAGSSGGGGGAGAGTGGSGGGY